MHARALLRAPEVAHRLRIPPHRVYTLIRRGRIPAVRIGRTVRAAPGEGGER